MKITVLGWYGTETIGDRAIMAGIFNIFSTASSEDIHLHWGSLYVPLTLRTWFEDQEFYREISGGRLKSCNVFYSLSKSELEKNVKDSDIVMVGGGPLIDDPAMFMIKYAFQLANKQGIKTLIMGSGWGTLNYDKYIKVSAELVEISDRNIFRDSKSVSECLKFAKPTPERVPVGLIDPAFIASQYFRSTVDTPRKESHVSVNLRELFVIDEPGLNKFTISDCVDVIRQIMRIYPDVPIRLIPMHTFTIGGDDRIICNKIAQIINSPQIEVQNEPLSLKETMQVYYDSLLCVGMRFHAILLQTVLNGRNYIMDYTEADNGKIISLLHQTNLYDSYKERYVSCENVKRFSIKQDVERIELADSLINSYKNQYVDIVDDLFNLHK